MLKQTVNSSSIYEYSQCLQQISKNKLQLYTLYYQGHPDRNPGVRDVASSQLSEIFVFSLQNPNFFLCVLLERNNAILYFSVMSRHLISNLRKILYFPPSVLVESGHSRPLRAKCRFTFRFWQ